MKFLILFLNIYLLGLFLLSCKDKEEFSADFEGTRIEATQHPAARQCTDICPPFCSCTCCGVYKIFPTDMVVPDQVNTLISLNFSIFKVSFPDSIILSVWQPPRLA